MGALQLEVLYSSIFLVSTVGKAQNCPQIGYTANFTSSNVSIIDLANKTSLGNITLPVSSAQTIDIAITPDGKFAYATNFNSGDVSVIDLSTNLSLPNNIPLPPSSSAGILGIAITPDGKYAYVTNQGTNTVAIIDLSTNMAFPSQITLPMQAMGSDYIAITPNGNYAYVTAQTGDGLSVIDLSNQTTSFIPLAMGSLPTSIQISPDGSYGYVINQGTNDVTIIDLSTNTPLPMNIPLPGGSSQPTIGAITPDGKWLYIANSNSNDVSVVDLLNNTTLPNISLPAGSNRPLGIAISSDQKFAYVSNYVSSDISIIDLTTNTAEPTNIPLVSGATGPFSIALVPCTQPPSSQVSGNSRKNAYFWQTDLYTIINWPTSSQSSPAYYALYRNNVFLQDVPANTFSFQDHYLQPNTTYLYSVYSVDGSGTATLVGNTSITTQND